MIAPSPPWVSGLLVALGLGAALVGGAGLAHADSTGTGSSPGRSSDAAHTAGHTRPTSTSMTPRVRPRTPRASAPATRLGSLRPTPPKPLVPDPSPVAVAALASARREPQTGLAGRAPRPTTRPAPVPAFVAASSKWLSELHGYLTGAPEAQPTSADVTPTGYGDIGKWMLNSSGGVSDWIAQQYPFKTLYQPINVIIVDPTSTSTQQSARKLNVTMAAAGFPAQPIHSSGFRGVIGGVVYGQQPAGTLQAFSNANWLLTNDHGRVFGPAPNPDGTGYVWTASFSREATGILYVIPFHVYVSFGKPRDDLRAALVAGGATDLGLIDLDNRLDGRTTTTGDHDGYAVVIQLN
ncbi:hypothetical protein ORI20_05915 [Mycobacterium sp. CVI_P3]|uniref:Uncharacterized protein n=1 Tax=Mycobacterium pinniadriaticum TaxID=2994102 RepID=A0ABT3SA13_9MYCO|nr:hypothetical protein [Mycobacterium pinniadriaticum]MCX2929798.1 hypothetical protein [Mycobacterium pinniadriaticum]MCX2936222.1 hypothetical protein [Mycobacterium pinniadriaticum]